MIKMDLKSGFERKGGRKEVHSREEEHEWETKSVGGTRNQLFWPQLLACSRT